MSERGFALSKIQAHLALENIIASKKSLCPVDQEVSHDRMETGC